MVWIYFAYTGLRTMKVAQFWFFKPRPLIWIVEILFQVFPLFKAPFKHHPFFRKKHVHLFFFKDVHRCINLCLAHFLWACTLSMAHIIKVACPHTRPWSVQKAGWALMCPAQSTHLLPFFFDETPLFFFFLALTVVLVLSLPASPLSTFPEIPHFFSTGCCSDPCLAIA